jgi:hypothetical protein
MRTIKTMFCGIVHDFFGLELFNGIIKKMINGFFGRRGDDGLIDEDAVSQFVLLELKEEIFDALDIEFLRLAEKDKTGVFELHGGS